MSHLFTPVQVGPLLVRNRAWVSPMCQYSCFAGDGRPTDWHLVHLGAFATGGFGLIVTEATAVAPEGRISPEDAGLWDQTQVPAWRRITDFAHDHGVPVAVQLAHAGRKASTYSPFSGSTGSVALGDGGWSTVGPSAGSFGELAECRALAREEVRAIAGLFGAAARRSVEAGFDAVEIHGAHGYLLHQFLSPLVNVRNDDYGGSFENRVRLFREVVAAVRAELTDSMALLVRLSATDWAPGGWDLQQTIELVDVLVGEGVDLVDVSSGGAVAHQQIETGPQYQVPFARAVRERTGMPTGAVGRITEPGEADALLSDGAADVVLLGRAALREPRWALRAASELGLDPDQAGYPDQLRLGAWPRSITGA